MESSGEPDQGMPARAVIALNDSHGYSMGLLGAQLPTTERMERAGELLVLGVREMYHLAAQDRLDDLGEVIIQLNLGAAQMAAGQLAMECARAGWEPCGDGEGDG